MYRDASPLVDRCVSGTDAGLVIGAASIVFDHAVVYHGFTDYMRDYDVYVYVYVPANAMPVGEKPHLRYRFRNCVKATVRSTVRPDVWSVSTDEARVRPLDQHDEHPEGYVWGVRWHGLYPGGRVVEDSDAVTRWRAESGLPFTAVRIETNAHDIELVFTDLEVTEVTNGTVPFEVVPEPRSSRSGVAAGRVARPSARAGPRSPSRSSQHRRSPQSGTVDAAGVTTMDDDRWDAVRLAMYALRPPPRWRTRDTETQHVSGWDREWYYHFREGGYSTIEWLEIMPDDDDQHRTIVQTLRGLGVSPQERSSTIVVHRGNPVAADGPDAP